MKHIVSYSGGKDSTAMLVRMIEQGMPVDDIVFVNIKAAPDLGAEFPEMYEYLNKVERYIERRITVVKSEKSFEEMFHQVYRKGSRTGIIYGYPLTIGAWCNDRLKLRTLNRYCKKYGKHIHYLGLAADETKRLARLRPNEKAPLAEWGMTEKDCMVFLEARGLLNPLYQKFCRLGCFFCVKQPISSLRIVRRDYPELWQRMLDWDRESPRSFKPGGTVHDYDRRFAKEDADIRRQPEKQQEPDRRKDAWQKGGCMEGKETFPVDEHI